MDFAATWEAAEWDATAAYRQGINTLVNMKGIDIFAVSKSRPLVCLIELKDFQNPRMSERQSDGNREKITSGALIEDVALKVIHSLVGVNHSYPRSAPSEPNLDALRSRLSRMMARQGWRLSVVLWIEDRTWLPPQLAALSADFQRQLHWLGPLATISVVTSQNTWPIPNSSIRVI